MLFREVVSKAKKGVKRILRGSNELPINWCARSRSLIEQDAQYAIQVAQDYLFHIEKIGLQLKGLNVLELGPGFEFGAQLILASYGCNITVADRYLAGWNPQYHPEFYKRLRALWLGPAAGLDAVLDQMDYPNSVLRKVSASAEELGHVVQPNTYDLVISNAVLEHIEDISRVVISLAKITKLDGFNIHQIDYRDHRNFKRPLQFLLLADSRHQRLFTSSHGEIGNRLRPSETISSFQQAGFQLIEFEKNGFVDERYLRSFLRRLRSCSSRYRDWPTDDLKVIGARLVLKKTQIMPAREELVS